MSAPLVTIRLAPVPGSGQDILRRPCSQVRFGAVGVQVEDPESGETRLIPWWGVADVVFTAGTVSGEALL